ncbi:MAG: MFS transporter [Bacteroidales bacterium]|nr:MFS transporter [Candidatus Cryptobacteroides aphodequi]
MSQTKSQNYTPAIIVMFALFFMIAFVTNFAGSMGVIVSNQFGASPALSQLGTLANFIAYLCMGIPGGIVLKRKGYKFTALLAVIVGFIGVGIQWIAGPAESFLVYVIGAFVAGFSMCLLNVVVNPMLNTLGGGGNKSFQLLNLGGSCNSIGGTLAPILLGFLIGGEAAKANVKDAAPAMIIAMAIFALAALIIALTNIPEPHMETPEEKAARKAGKAEKDPHGPLSFRHFVLGAVAIFFYVGIEVGIPNMSNLYMSQDLNMPAVAGTIVGFYWLCMLIGRLIGSAIGGKVSSKMMLTITSAVAIVFLVLVMYMPKDITVAIKGNVIPVSMMFMFLCGLCTSVMWGAIFNMAAEGLGKYTAPASGIFMTLVCGGGIIPFICGVTAKSVGYLQSYWILIACLLFLLFYALVGSKNVNTDIKVD